MSIYTKPDLVLIHAPAIYDFRKKPQMFGPVSDLVPSTPIFEIYPLGLTTIGEYLERNGHTVRLFNLGYLMLHNEKMDVEKFIRNLSAKAFGLDLHWMPHSHGVIEIARLLKKYHPNTPIMLGGLSSSVFHEDLITNYPEIDFVFRGDSTEEPVRQLMEIIRNSNGKPSNESLASVPNMTWRDSTGTMIVNELSFVPPDFNAPSLDFSFNMKTVIRDRDLFGVVPYKQWISYPMSATICCRGCTHNCVTCGGSQESYRKHYNRRRVAYRDPELIARDIAHAQKYIPGAIFVLNDFMQAGDDYIRIFIESLGKIDLHASIGFEVFTPPDEKLYELLAANLKDWTIEVSAESHDDEVRKLFGKGHYTTADVEKSIKQAFDYGATRFDLYYLIGIPGQNAQSVLDNVDYIGDLYEKFDYDKRLISNIAAMTPFLDPGSIAYDNPEAHGYKLRATTVEEHRELLVQPSWKYIMNYESIHLPPDELVDVTYEAGLRLNEMKRKSGLIDNATADAVHDRIEEAKVSMARVDAVMRDISLDTPEKREEKLGNLRREMEELSESTICEKTELRWPVNFRVANLWECIKLWAVENTRNILMPSKNPAASKVHEQWREEQGLPSIQEMPSQHDREERSKDDKPY
ncbi:MAG: TIGR04190 family B12-binding domain/radical SAM domain protein [Coriobacteriia bacterium]|nr:TIGR04190 family B12-binding domain/radical SAM domain protein [Coriobacteriia bacterium]MCL2536929.1 TIGR04190 family B12-binding domain/radical SAM domain protein [Coriobacteriia bacterium]